jgi:N-dimethylarginine dimethylaminohydrolase
MIAANPGFCSPNQPQFQLQEHAMASASTFSNAAYGGAGWSQRIGDHADDMRSLWRGGVNSEWRQLRTALLCRPGNELLVDDANQALQLAPLDLGRAQAEHDQLAEEYTQAGVEIIMTPDAPNPTPNRMFCADLFAMTPQGAILARPAAVIRAGEEVATAQALITARAPILRTLTGAATFEGADLMWLDAKAAIIGRGLRTNQSAIDQIGALCTEIGVNLTAVDMPFGTMHLMGMLRIVDKNLAIAWPRRTPFAAVTMLRDRGYHVEFLPDEDMAQTNRALNFVTLGPRKILMPGGNTPIRIWYETLGVDVIETPMTELRKAAGAVGCLTGVMAREMD